MSYFAKVLARHSFAATKVTAKGREFVTQAYFRDGVRSRQTFNPIFNLLLLTKLRNHLIRFLQVTRTM